MNAVWARLRVDARRRWRAWLGVALLVGLFGGIVTAAAAGARRTDNAYSRFVAANHGAEYMIDDFIPNPEAAVLDPKTVAALPSIAEADLFRVYGPAANVGPNYYLTPAFYRAHETSVAAFEFSLVRLRPGAADAAQHQVEALGRGRPVAVQQLGDQARDVNRSIHLVAIALWLLAGLLTVVAVLVLGQLLARQIALDATDYPVLHSLGMTRRQLVGLAVVRCTAIGAVGATLAVVVAIALSPLTPIGLARTAEPTPGLAFDTLVLVIAVVGITAIAAALALWPAWRAAKAASPALRTGDEDGLGRRSVVADASARAGLPATLTAGVRMALERGRGPTSVPVWTTIAFIQTGIDFRLGGRVLSGFAFTPVKGVAVGRIAWRLFAEQLGVIPGVSTPVVLLALVVPATILLANLISIGPAVAAMRTHPASVLREE